MRKVLNLTALALTLAAIPWAAAPNFGPAICADGTVWGTKGLSELPPPNGHNDQSFDKLFLFVNGAPGQLAVSEASPRNKDYNGGRRSAKTAMWTEAGLAFYNQSPPVLMSYDEVMMQVNLGYLANTPGASARPVYYLCPLLPVKTNRAALTGAVEARNPAAFRRICCVRERARNPGRKHRSESAQPA